MSRDKKTLNDYVLSSSTFVASTSIGFGACYLMPQSQNYSVFVKFALALFLSFLACLMCIMLNIVISYLLEERKVISQSLRSLDMRISSLTTVINENWSEAEIEEFIKGLIPEVREAFKKVLLK